MWILRSEVSTFFIYTPKVAVGGFFMNRVFNFSAGPSMLPLPVLEKAAAELVCYGESGMSVMEMSHRSPDYEAIIADAEAMLRRLMNIPDNYKVLFLQGGAREPARQTMPFPVSSPARRSRKRRSWATTLSASPPQRTITSTTFL